MTRTARMSCGLWALACLLPPLAIGTDAAAQTRVHSVGNVELTVPANDRIWNEGFGNTLIWPRFMGSRHRALSVSWLQHVAMGGYTAPTGNRLADAQFGGHEADHLPVPGGIRRVLRHPQPTIVVNGQTQAQPQVDAVDPELPADEMVEIQYNFHGDAGFRVTRRSYTFADPRDDDFLLVDYLFQATRDTDGNGEPDLPDQVFEDVVFGINQGYQITPAGSRSLSMNAQDADVWGSWETIQGPLSGRSLTYTLVRDGDNPTAPGDDTGDPATGAAELGPVGRFLSEAWVGFGPLHVSTVPVADPADSQDDPSQPWSIGRTRRLAVFGSPLALPSAILRSGTREAGAIDTNPNAELDIRYANLEYQGFGPYPAIRMGETVRIALALGFGGISQATAISEGQRYARGELDAAGKNALIAQGRDSLRANMDRAALAFQRMEAGQAPSALASPNLTVQSEAGLVRLEWSSVEGATSYEVWRADADARNPSSLLTTQPGTSYEDRAATPGVDYFYHVVARDGERASSVSLNRTTLGASPLRVGLSTTRDVRVVPNPYSITAGSAHFNPSDPNRIRFFNLPARASIRIYTESGNLVATIQHEDGTADTGWDLRSSGNQYVATGIYLAVIDDARDPDGTPLPRSTVKFVVVR